MLNDASKKPKSRHRPRTNKAAALQYVGHGMEQERVALLERLPDAFVIVDTQWRFTYVNRQAETLLGKTREALLGRHVWEIFPIPADSSVYRDAHEAMDKQTSLEFTVFHPLLRKWLAVRLYPFQDGLYSYCKDITEHKQAEEQLQLQANTLWEVSKSVIATDLQGKIIYWNEGASRLFGYSAQEMLGKTLIQLYPRLEQQQLTSDLEQIKNGKDYVGLWQGRRKDGITVWIDIKTTLLYDTEGKPVGYIGIAQEASAHKQVVEEFLYYARLAQNQMDAVIATDTNYNILSWNEAAERLYGWKEEEVLHKFVDDILHTEFFTTTGTESSQRLLSKGYWKGEVIQRRKDGTQLLILASVSVIKDGTGKMIGAIAANRDMSVLEERRPVESDKQRV